MSFRKILIPSLLGLLLVAAVGCGGSGESSTDVASERSSKSSSNGSANVKTELNIAFDAEGFSHTVNYVLDNWANPEDTYGFETADEGFRLVAVNITVANTGTEEEDVNQLYYTLDFGGAEPAEASYYGSSASNISRFKTTTLAPGASTTGDLLLEVPSDSTQSTWSIVYNSDPFGFREGYQPMKVSLKK